MEREERLREMGGHKGLSTSLEERQERGGEQV